MTRWTHSTTSSYIRKVIRLKIISAILHVNFNSFLKLILFVLSGIKALSQSVNMIANGTAPRITQPEEGASYDAALFKPETHMVSLFAYVCITKF